MTNLTELEQTADREARHGHRELVKRLEARLAELEAALDADGGPWRYWNRKAVEKADECISLRARVSELEAARDALLPWAMLGQAVMDGWPEIGDLDGFDLQDLAVEHGVLREVPGGYDPEHHFDSLGVGPERGDPWFEIVQFPDRAMLAAHNEGGSDD